MDATAWTVVGSALVLLVAIAASFRSLRVELRSQADRNDAQGKGLRDRIDALRDRIDAQGQELRDRIDAQGQELRDRIDAQGQELREQLGQLRERMAKLEGLLEGLREAITGKRAA